MPPGIASLDLFVVRTISFKLLYGLVILGHLRRRLVRISVTANPTAQWIAGQVTEAFPWDEPPRYLLGTERWESMIIRPRRARRGKTVMSSD